MKNIISALIKFQSIVPKISNDKTNPHFRNNYASLSGIIETINESLTKCDLTFYQRFTTDERSERNLLMTTLAHSSGEIIDSTIILPEIADPQKMGSAITYYKRYSLLAILSLSSADEDDDAQGASQEFKTPPKPAYKPSSKPASPAQLKSILAWAARTKVVIENPESMTSDQAQEYFKKMNEGKQ